MPQDRSRFSLSQQIADQVVPTFRQLSNRLFRRRDPAFIHFTGEDLARRLRPMTIQPETVKGEGGRALLERGPDRPRDLTPLQFFLEQEQLTQLMQEGDLPFARQVLGAAKQLVQSFREGRNRSRNGWT